MANRVAFFYKVKRVNYQVLARRCRPKIFADVIGQTAVLKALQFSLQSGRIHHAYLFTGTRGVGKTTLARILAKALSCEQGVKAEPCNQCANCQAIDGGKFIDVLEIDAASRTKVEDTRELLDNVPYAPVVGRYKIYIIDEVHMLSNHSFNALLKTLEEPPEHVKFLFATTDPQKLPVTILSRCLQFQLSSFASSDITNYLQQILTAEKIQFTVQALQRLSIAANGSVRDALTLLEQVIASGQENITDAVVANVLGIANYELLLALLTAVLEVKVSDTLAIISRLQQAGVDFNKVLQELLMLLHKIAVIQMLPGGVIEGEVPAEQLLQLAKDTSPETVQLLYQLGINGKKDLAYAPDLAIGFSMTMLRMLAFQPLQMAEVMPLQQDNQQAVPQRISQPADVIGVMSPRRSVEPLATLPAASASVPEVPHQHQPIPEWDELIYAMQLSGLTKAIAQHCVIASWQDNKICLTLDHVHTALLQPHHEKKLQQAISAHLGYAVQVKINIDQILTETPAGKQNAERAKIQQAAEASMLNNPNVQQILQTFDAKLEKVIVRDDD